MQLQRRIDEFEARGIQIVAVCTDPPEQLRVTKSRIKADFPFVSDRGGMLLDQFGLRDHSGSPFDDRDIAQSSNLLFSASGELLWAHYAENYRVRLTPDDILEAAGRVLPVDDPTALP